MSNPPMMLAEDRFWDIIGERMPEGTAHGPDVPAGHQIDRDDSETMRRLFSKLVVRFPDLGD